MQGLRIEVIAQRHGFTLAEQFLEGTDMETRIYRAPNVALTVHNYHLSTHYAGVDSTWAYYQDNRIFAMGHSESHLNHVLPYAASAV